MSRAAAIVLALMFVPSLALAAQGAPTADTPAQFQPVSNSALFSMAFMVAGDEGGVYATASFKDGPNPGLYYITPDRTHFLREGAFRGLARDADGAIYTYLDDLSAAARLESGTDVPVARFFAPIGFGADGQLYGNRGNLLKVDASRVVTTIGLGANYYATMGPDGNIYGCDGSGRILRTDTVTGVTTVVARPTLLCIGTAFDASGVGYFAAFDGTVRTFDRVSGANGTIVATGIPGQYTTLAFSGTRLWAGWFNTTRFASSGGIGYFEMGVQGFEGFRPDFDMPPLPDLAVVDFREVRAPIATPVGEVENSLNEARKLVLTVRNEGLVASTPAPVHVSRQTGLAPGIGDEPPVESLRSEWTATLPALAPGESRTLTFRWDTTSSIGRQVLHASVDSPYHFDEGNLEMDESDNEATVTTVVRAPLGVGPW